MKKEILKLIILLVVLGVIAFYMKNNFHLFDHVDRVDAAGALTFDLGVPNGQPIFTFHNIAPGFSQSHTVTVHNGDTTAHTVSVKGIKTSGTGNLENGMSIVITQNGTDIYGGASATGYKTLAQFFQDSQSTNGVELTSVAKNASTSYVFTVTFDAQSGNQYQGKNVTFDLQFGIFTDIPEACGSMKFSKTLYGTDGNDTLKAGSDNTLIVSFDGDDKITLGSGNVCVISGNGNNTIKGGSGRAIIVVGDGNNTITGGSGNETITLGNGDNTIKGGSGNITIHAGIGNNKIKKGSGKITQQ